MVANYYVDYFGGPIQLIASKRIRKLGELFFHILIIHLMGFRQL